VTARKPFDLDLDTASRLVGPATTVTRLTGGILSSVFEVRRADGTAVIVKVYPEEERWKLEKEVFVYGRLGNVAAPIASVVGRDDALNALVLTRLNGLHVASLLEELSEDDIVTINRQIGVFLRELHRVGCDAFGYVGTSGIIREHETNLDYMRVQFARKLRDFAELGGDADLHDAIERHVAERAELFAGCDRPAFCHNDCHYGNVLVTGLDVTGLLDFEGVLAGDPLLDLAKTHCYYQGSNERTLAALIDGYGPVRSDWREAVELYVLYHALELWDFMASLGETEHLASLESAMKKGPLAGP
jgi:aminoglycoside phosphotransferase (APT) family kinase protein